jgi:hypothetical protein
MIGSAFLPQHGRAHSPERRRLLGLLTAASIVAPAVLLTGCAHAIPPRQYKRPASYNRGGDGGGGKAAGGGRGGN